jgi:Tol biopolymer transport system component
MDRNGRETETVGDPGEYHNPDLSNAGDRLAFDLADPRTGKTDIWVRDIARGVNSRFTFDSGSVFSPKWSPDGKWIVYTVDNDLFVKPADGRGEAKLLFKSDDLKFATDWSRDGKTIAYCDRGEKTSWDIYTIPAFGDGKPAVFRKTPFADLLPAFSPDGHLIAYMSNESGRQEIYVESYPEAGGKWQISAGGGVEPRWRADGKELFYRAADQKMMAVDIAMEGGNLKAGLPHALFVGRYDTATARNRFLTSADGQRFLLVAPLGRDAMSPTTVVLNWAADLGK